MADDGRDWLSDRFVYHYFFGKGQPVRLRATGNLVKVANSYISLVRSKLAGQIADAAREVGRGSFTYDFEKRYKMERVVFSLGETTIGGVLQGQARPARAGLGISGTFEFYLRESFEDPLDIEHMREELRKLYNGLREGLGLRERKAEIPGGTKYDIHDRWRANLRGWVLSDASGSIYKKK